MDRHENFPGGARWRSDLRVSDGGCTTEDLIMLHYLEKSHISYQQR